MLLVGPGCNSFAVNLLGHIAQKKGAGPTGVGESSVLSLPHAQGGWQSSARGERKGGYSGGGKGSPLVKTM